MYIIQYTYTYSNLYNYADNCGRGAHIVFFFSRQPYSWYLYHMVFGNSEYDAHVLGEIYNLFWKRHLFTTLVRSFVFELHVKKSSMAVLESVDDGVRDGEEGEPEEESQHASDPCHQVRRVHTMLIKQLSCF